MWHGTSDPKRIKVCEEDGGEDDCNGVYVSAKSEEWKKDGMWQRGRLHLVWICNETTEDQGTAGPELHQEGKLHQRMQKFRNTYMDNSEVDLMVKQARMKIGGDISEG